MIMSESIIKISVDLVKAQKEMSTPIKDSYNLFFKSKYADLNSVREACISALNNNNISVIQPICVIDSKNYVKTLLIHVSGEFIGGISEIKIKQTNDPQAEGSGISYARRYGLQSLLCLGGEDDDGNRATNKPNEMSDKEKQEMVKRLKSSINPSKWADIVSEYQKKYPYLENDKKFQDFVMSLKPSSTTLDGAKIAEDAGKELNHGL